MIKTLKILSKKVSDEIQQSAGCLVISMDTGRLSLQLRNGKGKWRGTWGLWGGGIDKDEDPLSGMLRELHEETGYTGPYKRILKLKRRIRPKQVYYGFLVIVPTEFKHRIDKESKDAKWFSLLKVNKLIEANKCHPGVSYFLNDEKTRELLKKYCKI